MNIQNEIDAITTRIQREVEEAERRGLVVTVERIPLVPLAMGRAKHQVHVRLDIQRLRRWRDYQDRVLLAEQGKFSPDEGLSVAQIDGSD